MDDRQKKRLKKFIAALRSGKYVQGRSSLHIKGHDGNPDKFCCLGVACQVALKSRVNLDVVEGYKVVSYDNETGYLPDKLVDYYGFDSGDPVISDEGIRIAATSANDSEEYDFTKIADLFEYTYLSEEANVAAK